MDLATFTLLASMTALLLRGVYVQFDALPGLTVRFVRAKAGLKSVGGIWFAIIGAPLAAWFLFQFWIAPYLGLGNYAINIQTVLALSNPTAILIFLALWFGIAFGWIGGAALYRRNGSKK
jgi:hypothetical protein